MVFFWHGRSISSGKQTSTAKGSVFLNANKFEWCNNSIFMVYFLCYCEVIILEGRQGLVTPQLVILQCSLILERSVFQKSGSATIGPTFKYFLLSPHFSWEEFVKRKKNHSLFTFHVLSALMCLYFIFYKPCFSFLGSFDQNLSLGSASLHPSCSMTEPISLARHPEAHAAKRVVCVWVWVSVCGCDTCRATAPSHVSPEAWEPH